MDMAIRTLSLEEYPAQLREIPQAPERLFLRGNLPPKGYKRLAVVGSRALTPYGRSACESLIAGLNGQSISIISGLALGADAVAHEAALNAGLHTLAVLASGVDDASIGPRANMPLAARILESGGGILSESPEGYSPFPADFPKRNRIVAGLADAVLIIEAGERSGTLITARLAGEYNRDLLCVPHRSTDPGGYGAQLFIRLGAAYVTESEHILEALGLRTEKPEESFVTGSHEDVVYAVLAEPCRREELIERSGLPESEALTALVMLELKGKVRQEYGLWKRAE